MVRPMSHSVWRRTFCNSFSTRLPNWHDGKRLVRKRKSENDETSSEAEERVLSHLDASARKQELGQSFPGLAVPNLTHAVKLDGDFYEHSKQEQEHRSRNVSNLPAWMTETTKPAPSKRSKLTDQAPQLHGIYRGTVRKVLDFGLVVTLPEFDQKEGMVHLAQISTQRIRHPSESTFARGQSVWVKVISMANDKLLLSTKDVDQTTGKGSHATSCNGTSGKYVNMNNMHLFILDSMYKP